MQIQRTTSIETNSARQKSSNREIWKKFRIEIETQKAKSNVTGFYPKRSWLLFAFLLKIFGACLAVTGLYWLGNWKAKNIKVKKMDIEIADLPEEFENYEIIHLSDLHFDRVIGIEERIVELVGDRNPDLIVLTGDYKDDLSMNPERYEGTFEYLGKFLKAKDGMFATLGNHDTHDLVPVIEKSGIHTLQNESLEIKRGKSKITLTGLDDVHYYFSDRVFPAMESAPKNDCKILLVHSPEIVPEAAKNGYSLYLCGHTHSGQVGWPNDKAIVTHVNTGEEYAVGRWHHGKMQGYTSSGTGVSGLTVRFFTDSEIAVIRLKRPVA